MTGHTTANDPKAVILSQSDLGGGAAIAAYRLFQGLHSIEYPAQMMVSSKASYDPGVFGPPGRKAKAKAMISAALDSALNRFSNLETDQVTSADLLPTALGGRVLASAPDILNVHWIGAGATSPRQLAKTRKHLVWTLHDMWAFCGQEHYTEHTERFVGRKARAFCAPKDMDQRVWQHKLAARKMLGDRVSVVTPSRWLSGLARESDIFHDVDVKTIPYGIDLDLFRPIDRQTARSLLGCPEVDGPVLVFGAALVTDHRKGIDLLLAALREMAGLPEFKDLLLVSFGGGYPTVFDELPFRIHHLGALKDQLSVVLAYSAADVVVTPSRMDNLPFTVLEPLACGRSVVGFDIGGVPDMIDHLQNGYLAKPFDIEDLAQGIAYCLQGGADRRQALDTAARHKAETCYRLEQQAIAYRDLFRTLAG